MQFNTFNLSFLSIKLSLAVIVASLMVLRLNLVGHLVWLGVLVLGLVLGIAFVYLDKKFFYPLYVKQTQLKGLLSQSLIFLVIFLPVAVFIVTSSSSPLGIGFVLGFMISSAVDLFVLLKDPALFQATYLYQFSRDFAADEQRLIALSFSGVSLLVALLAIFRI